MALPVRILIPLILGVAVLVVVFVGTSRISTSQRYRVVETRATAMTGGACSFSFKAILNPKPSPFFESRLAIDRPSVTISRATSVDSEKTGNF